MDRVKTFLKKHFLLFAVFAIIVGIGVAIWVPSYSETTTSTTWDGTVATSFASGSGTSSDPYIISTGSELAYLFSDVLTDSDYYNKFYELTNNIDMNGREFPHLDVNSSSFSGTINGNGYSIYNFTLSTPNVIESSGISQYSLIPNMSNATIKNINMYNVTMSVNNLNSDAEIAFLSTRASGSTISNVSCYDINLSLSIENGYENSVTYSIGGLLDNDLGNNSLSNVNIDFGYDTSIYSDSNVVAAFINDLSNSTDISNAFINATSLEIYADGSTQNTTDTIYPYGVSNNSIYFKENYSSSVLIEYINNSTTDFDLSIDGSNIRIVSNNSNSSSGSEEESAAFSSHNSGISGGVVYVNNLVQDEKYFIGKNYTYTATDVLPTEEDKNIYNSNTLVRTQLTYKGNNYDNSFTGYVSLDEQYGQIVYYDLYYVNNNGTPSNYSDDYVKIELIDNPWADRPNDRVFNGWYVDSRKAYVTYEPDYYLRYLIAPVTYTDGVPNDIVLDIYSAWTTGKIVEKGEESYWSSAGSWEEVFDEFETAGLHALTHNYTYAPYSMYGYYLQATARNGSRYTGYLEDGTYVNRQRCRTSSGCTYYEYINSRYEYYDDNTTYYELVNGHMTAVNPEDLDFEIESVTPNPALAGIMAGYYEKALVPYGSSLAGYYETDGNMITSGTCNTRAGCQTYRLLQLYDSSGNIEMYNENKSYYYMVTRDTNVAYLTAGVDSAWSDDKPFTLTGINNGVSYVDSGYLDVSYSSIQCYADTRIEHIRINANTTASNNANPGSSGSSNRYLYGNYHNVKVGRGITRYSTRYNYLSFTNILGGTNSTSTTGSAANPVRYRLIVESGFYDNITLTNGGYSTSTQVYIAAQGVWGNDIDRVRNVDTNLDVYYDANGSWGFYYRPDSNNDYMFDVTIKSGNFGSGKYDNSVGVYVGGRMYGLHYGVKRLYVQGGYIYNINGGPMAASSREEYNDTVIEMVGGTVDNVFGGAGTSATYGNRIVQVTGGTVNYSVFGGSNGYDGTDGDGTLNGTSYVYVGGNAVIGNGSDTINAFGIESGSVFGVGNGKSSSSEIGSCDNSIVIINGGTVKRNVYGGGNYGATAASSSHNTSYTHITINDGTINGSVYGGGNNNGSGSSSITSTINITMNAGTVSGSIYGGSRTSGTIYGNSNVYVNGGKITTDVYGGGEGSNTYVTGNVDVNVGVEKIENGVPVTSNNPEISGSVYGGSAFGTVNSASKTTTSSNKTTNVTITNGKITGDVFGCAKGDNSNTPYVVGNVTVNYNGGTSANVYGGFNQAGILATNSTCVVNLNGGTTGNAYGAGSNVGLTTTNINLAGTTVNNDVYGGANNSGDVTTANVSITAGSATNVFGGNNKGGTCSTTIVTASGPGAVISSAIYGGGNQVGTTTTNLVLSASANRVPNVFGAGNAAGAETTNVDLNGIDVSTVYGGANSAGNVTNTNVRVNAKLAYDAIYGGGSKAPAGTTNVIINDASSITNAFGGGYSANTANANIAVYNGNITNLYGGNNDSGIATATSVDVYGGTIGSVYGGGNKAVAGTTQVAVENGSIGVLYAGGNAANVTGNTELDITGGTIINNAYGGGNDGQVQGNTDVNFNAGTVQGSIYAGGNGTSAIVLGNTHIVVSGDAVVGTSTCTNLPLCSVFGGGNKAETGIATGTASTATVEIAGGTFHGNIYGGANTSVVNGYTNLVIGANVQTNDEVIASDIDISGSVFGGGEANAAGNESYDWTFISVTKGITVDINGLNYDVIEIDGSIFGSGNASSSGGTSVINISNFGTYANPKVITSIQRTDTLTYDNSCLNIKGAYDRTSDWADEYFSMILINHVILKNNSTLFLENGTYCVSALSSLTSTGEKAKVVIEEGTGITSRNVNNRIYIFEGRVINIASDSQVTNYGEVNGMTFFGLFRYNADDTVDDMIYGDVSEGATLDWGDLATKGSYVLGLHKNNHDIKVDGFYSNFMDEEQGVNEIKYIEPIPEDSNFYQWILGELVNEYPVNLQASKYSTLGAADLTLNDFAKANTTFTVLGVDYSELGDGVSLINEADIPRLASSSTVADTQMGLTMKNGNSGWLTDGKTEFVTNSTSDPVQGTETYVGANSTNVPILQFYLYHSKNIGTAGEMGTVRITLMAVTKISAILSETKRLVVVVNMSRILVNSNDYEGAIAPGRQYSLFASSVTNITSKSAVSAYFSLFAQGESVYKNGYHRALVSTYALPLNTKITMIDLSGENPVYYYHTITASDVSYAESQISTEGDVAYDLSMFEIMGAENSGVYYDDAAMNSQYYLNDYQVSSEEFIFIIDFVDTEITEDALNNSLVIEMQNADDQTIISILGQQYNSMKYSIYANKDAVIDVNGTADTDTLYSGNSEILDIVTTYTQSTNGASTVYDTNYYDSKLGLKLSIIDSEGQVVTGTSLLGLYYEIDKVKYYPNIDGSTRIKIADKVGNVETWIKVVSDTANIETGQYYIRVESFGSPDGIYYGLESSDYVDIPMYFVNEIYGLKVDVDDESLLVDSATGKNMAGSENIVYNINYDSQLSQPNIHIRLYRRDYDSIYDPTYTLVDLSDYVTNLLTTTEVENDYLVSDNPSTNTTIGLNMKSGLITGTYKIQFILYDGTTEIGTVDKYMIIK